jgi:predicted AAA+ superfamily ATPase
MLAAVHGQEWNGNALGASLDLSYKTVGSYVDYLEGAFLIRRLAPYSANIRKRLKKKPKVYWRDTGLLHAVLNVTDADALLSQPWVGASWEGYVIEQIINRANLLGVDAEYYHFRTSDRKELDLVMDFGKELWAVEVKLTSAPSRSDLQVLEKTAELIGATRSILISQTRESVTDGSRTSCSLKWFLKNLADGA